MSNYGRGVGLRARVKGSTYKDRISDLFSKNRPEPKNRSKVEVTDSIYRFNLRVQRAGLRIELRAQSNL